MDSKDSIRISTPNLPPPPPRRPLPPNFYIHQTPRIPPQIFPPWMTYPPLFFPFPNYSVPPPNIKFPPPSLIFPQRHIQTHQTYRLGEDTNGYPKSSTRCSSSSSNRATSSGNVSSSTTTTASGNGKCTKEDLETFLSRESKVLTKCIASDSYTSQNSKAEFNSASVKGLNIAETFEKELLSKTSESNSFPFSYGPLSLTSSHKCKGNCENSFSSEDEEDDREEEEEEDGRRNSSLAWMEHRIRQPDRLHPDLWENRSEELNDGPNCRCSLASRSIGIRHQIYQGENESENSCKLNLLSNNSDSLFHYRLLVFPSNNFIFKDSTVIIFENKEFVFDGFSLLTTCELSSRLPLCKVVRFNIEYSLITHREKNPKNFVLKELELFHIYFFDRLLDLVDWSLPPRFYFLPRFLHISSENERELLPMSEVLSYLLSSHTPLIDPLNLGVYMKMSKNEWQKSVADTVRGSLVVKHGFKPPAFRVDQLDRENDENTQNDNVINYPVIVHFGLRPSQLCFAGHPEYQRTWKDYKKLRHLLANMPKPSYSDKKSLEELEDKLMAIRMNSKTKRDVTVTVSSEGFYKTGLRVDIVQHGMLLPVLINHLRMHSSLDVFEKSISYKFKNRNLLQLALTHPSYKENFGTTSDHARNTLTNCGIRTPEFGDRKVHYVSNRKRGINTLIQIMARFGRSRETESQVRHNERLEFLGDAVVEFITSVHLFHMFPDLEEGGLATYRAALVQNQHFSVLAKVLGLEKYMLYAHGADLCHDAELRHAMANCFEAVMGAIYLDGGINEADRIFADALFGSDSTLHEIWTQLPPHPLQAQEPNGDRHWIQHYPLLQKLTEFEELTGIQFKNIRLLARAFTDRSIGLSNLTLGSNQRLEFLGDTVLQLITSNYLYRHFPEHHEGHLSLLRSSIVNNRTQSVVCDDLGMPRFARLSNPKADLKTKDRADLLEAFLGALYVDKDLQVCSRFCEVVFFPRLQQFILNQEWNDPKSKLQQCCLTLRTMDGKEPDIPIYKVIESKGPTNTRVYTVAVYFRGERLAKSNGPSIQAAEMNAAKDALENCKDLFPHLRYQKKVVERSFFRQSLDNKRKYWKEEKFRINQSIESSIKTKRTRFSSGETEEEGEISSEK